MSKYLNKKDIQVLIKIEHYLYATKKQLFQENQYIKLHTVDGIEKYTDNDFIKYWEIVEKIIQAHSARLKIEKKYKEKNKEKTKVQKKIDYYNKIKKQKGLNEKQKAKYEKLLQLRNNLKSK